MLSSKAVSALVRRATAISSSSSPSAGLVWCRSMAEGRNYYIKVGSQDGPLKIGRKDPQVMFFFCFYVFRTAPTRPESRRRFVT